MYVHEKSFDTHDFQFGCVFKNVSMNMEWAMCPFGSSSSRAQQQRHELSVFSPREPLRGQPAAAAAVKLNN